MAGPRREARGQDGVRIVETPGISGRVWRLVAATALGAVFAAIVVHVVLDASRRPVTKDVEPGRPRLAMADDGVRSPDLPRPSAVAAATTASPQPMPTLPPGVVLPSPMPAPDPLDAELGHEPPPMFGFAGKPGEKSGIGLFPSADTKPIKRGIVVPDDFDLPPGYVRHYQATADGELVGPILMFSPDVTPRDADGNPVPVPPDRVVPPELAPSGMPIRFLEPPAQRPPDGTR